MTPDTGTTRQVRVEHGSAGVAAVLGGVVSGGAGAVLIKLVGLGGVALAVHRTWVALLLLYVMLHVRGGRMTRQVLAASWPGGLAFAIMIVLVFEALKATAVADVVMITSLRPVLIAVVVGPLFGEHLSLREAGWGIVAMIGVVVVVVGSVGAPVWSIRGDLLACGGLLASSAYLAASKQARAALPTLEYQVALTVTALVVLLPTSVVTGTSLTVPSTSTWLGVVVVAVVPTVSHLLINWAHPRTPLFLTSTLMLGVPAVAMLGAALVLDERLVPAHVIGAAIVVSALIGVLSGNGSTDPDLAPAPPA